MGRENKIELAERPKGGGGGLGGLLQSISQLFVYVCNSSLSTTIIHSFAYISKQAHLGHTKTTCGL